MLRPRLTVSLALVLAVATTPAVGQTPRYGGLLVTSPLSAPPSLSPHEEATIATVDAASPCFNNLVYFDPMKKLAVFGANLLGDALRDTLDPRLRGA